MNVHLKIYTLQSVPDIITDIIVTEIKHSDYLKLVT